MSATRVEASDDREASSHALRPWLGGVLVLSVALQLVGAFLRYATVVPRFPSGDVELIPLPTSISFTFFAGLTMGGRPAFLATLGLVAVFGCVFMVRPGRACAGFTVGFCGPSVGAAAYSMVEWTRGSATYSFGHGFFVLLVGISVEAAIAASLFVGLWSTRKPSDRAASPSVLALCTAITAGAATLFVASKFGHYQPLARFAPLTLASAAAAFIAFAAAAALPLLAYRISGRVGAAIAAGVAVGMTIQVFDALLRRTQFGVQITIGWWIDVAAMVLSTVLARRLARGARDAVEATVTNA